MGTSDGGLTSASSDTTVHPGHTVPLHTHRWPAVHYILTWSDFIRRDPTGAILLDTRTNATRDSPQHPPEGTASWSGPLAPHTLENVGESSLHVISMELKTSCRPEACQAPPEPPTPRNQNKTGPLDPKNNPPKSAD